MALGDIWLAGANGSCENAGTCVHGPCGPGENTGSDCPTYWEHTAEYSFSYTPGGSVFIQGITINPGETIGILRGTLSEPVPLEYPVEYFRGEITPPDYDPVAAGVTSIVLSNFPTGWGPISTGSITLTKVTGDVYERRVSGTLRQRIRKVSGVWCWYDTTLGSGFGTILPVGPYDHGRVVFSPGSVSFVYPSGECALRYPYNLAIRGGWPNPTVASDGFIQGDYHSDLDGLPVYRWYLSEAIFGFWHNGIEIWEGATPSSTSSSGVNICGPGGSPPASDVVVGSTGYQNRATMTPVEMNGFWFGGASFTADAVFTGGTPPDDPINPAVFKWGVLAYPAPRQTLIPGTVFGDIPLEASPGEETLEWARDTFADQITLISNPTTAQSGTIRLTIRSACENPPP